MRPANTKKIFSKEYLALDKKVKDSINIYEKATSVIDKTNLVLGRKTLFKNVTASTKDTPVENNLSKSTYEV